MFHTRVYPTAFSQYFYLFLVLGWSINHCTAIFNFSSPDCSLSVHTSITVYVLLHEKRGEQERPYRDFSFAE